MEKINLANEFQQKYKIKHKFRPLFHLTAPVGWLNDPNGFSEYKGKKHLFYQYNPYSIHWDQMHWGHALTDDFIKWKDLPIALAPDSKYDNYGCFSGSAIQVDDQHVLVYTGAILENKENSFAKQIQTQCLAIGDGTEYKKHELNPIIDFKNLPEGFSPNDFRDPKIWLEKDNTYRLVVGNLDEKELGQVLLFKSNNLTDWEFVSVLKHNDNGQYGTMWECPDFFELENQHVLLISPMDMLAGKDDIISGNHSIYFLGNYNEVTNQLEQQDGFLIDYGSEFYAPQTMLTDDGRRIMIAWLSSWDHIIKERDQHWLGMMTIPRELSIKDNRLIQRPIEELKNYWDKEYSEKNLEFENTFYADELKGRTVDLEIEILEGDFENFIIHFNHNSEFDTKIIYDKYHQKIIFDRIYSGIRRDFNNKREFSLLRTNEPIKLRLILDRYSAELFVNDGSQTLSAITATPSDADQIFLECDGNCKINLNFHEIDIEEDE